MKNKSLFASSFRAAAVLFTLFALVSCGNAFTPRSESSISITMPSSALSFSRSSDTTDGSNATDTSSSTIIFTAAGSGYSTSKSYSISLTSSAFSYTFVLDDMPVGQKMTITANVYSNSKLYFTGTSSEFTVAASGNTVSIAMKSCKEDTTDDDSANTPSYISYYVSSSTAGSDSNNGTAASTPFATLAAAFTAMQAASSGTYTDEKPAVISLLDSVTVDSVLDTKTVPAAIYLNGNTITRGSSCTGILFTAKSTLSLYSGTTTATAVQLRQLILFLIMKAHLT